jgi:hypothetical protein
VQGCGPDLSPFGIRGGALATIASAPSVAPTLDHWRRALDHLHLLGLRCKDVHVLLLVDTTATSPRLQYLSWQVYSHAAWDDLRPRLDAALR